MKMDVVARRSVNLSFGVGQFFKDRYCARLHLLTQTRAVDDLANVCKFARGLFAFINRDIELDGRNAAACDTLNSQVIATQAERRQLFAQCIEFDAEVDQRADQHVAADTCKAVDIEHTHQPRSLRNCGRISPALPSTVMSAKNEM